MLSENKYLADFLVQETPNLVDPYIYITTVLYDICLLPLSSNCFLSLDHKTDWLNSDSSKQFRMGRAPLHFLQCYPIHFTFSKFADTSNDQII